MVRAIPFAFQLYSGRKFPPLEDQLETLAALGYQAIEPYGGLYGEAGRLKAAADRHGLAIESGHIGIDALESNLEGAAATAKALGMSLLIVPFIAPEARPQDAQGWKGLGARLSRIAAGLKERGLAFAWHNHNFEFGRLPDGSFPIEHILGDDPGVLWQADLAWIVRAGEDPVRWLGRYRGRVISVHVKDIAPAGTLGDEDGWADVGTGTLAWNDLWRAARDAGARLFVAEHDNPSDYRRFARRSIEAMKLYAGGQA